MKSTLQHGRSNIYRKSINTDSAVSKKIILLAIVQTVFFYLYSLLSSMGTQNTMVKNIAIAGLLISALTFINLLIVLKWGGKSAEQKLAAFTQLALPLVLAGIWVYMLL